VRVVIGTSLDLAAWSQRRVSEPELLAAGTLIQDTLARLLPPARRPAPGTPAIGKLDADAG
jgi:hypothetical protein